jgi:DNA-binding NarL/FixJ family response regulator
MASGGSVRVLLVDDSEPFRRFISEMLLDKPELQVVCESSDGLEAVLKAEQLQPNLILLDIGLPRLNGIEAARRISRLAPGAKILFVSQETDADVIAEALSNGGKGYVWKQNANLELLSAIQAVLQGNAYVSGELRSND